MTEYVPTSRRPIADLFRATAKLPVKWCVALGVHPDAVSYSSIVASAIAAVCFSQSLRWPWLLIPAVGLCYVRLWLNMLDGMVAIASGKASLRGEILNDLPDRISDVFVFAGVAHSGLCNTVLAYWVAIGALFVAYIGVFGQAVGAGRQYGGLMSKPWRMVTLHIGAWITLVLLWCGARRGEIPVGSLTVLDWTCIVILVGCVQTVWVRMRAILRGLRARAAAMKTNP